MEIIKEKRLKKLKKLLDMTGINYERELKEILHSKGWLVFRSAGSFVCDLIALRPNEHKLIEVKSTKRDKYYTSDSKEQFDVLNNLAKEGFNVWYYMRWKNKKPKWSTYQLPLESYPIFLFKKEKEVN